MLLMIDNYDSFTYNLVQYFRELGVAIHTYRNDEITLDDISALKPEKIILSPGPGRPVDAGISMPIIQQFAQHIPILGVCLGHQAIAECFGAQVINAPAVMHGKTSQISHNDQGVFQNLSNPFTATRYHSLVVDPQSLPDEIEITAWSKDDACVMGIQHKQLPLQGVQFHPESILTEHGHQLLQNFIHN